MLAPAGDMEKMRFALAYGADAVYLGGENFSLREKSNNFTLAEIREAVAYCHEQGKKVYVAVNIFAHNDDIARLPAYLKVLGEIGPDALLISDPGVFLTAKEQAPGVPIHISTQANNVNWKTVSFWQTLGAARVVLGRELSLPEIREIAANTTAELELFVHGAVCMAYSGRCLLSNYLTGRDANRGACTHPCRWRYVLEEEKRPGEYLPIEEDDRGSYIMNSNDLNLLAYLPELTAAGIASFKIEGRVKSSYYVAVVAKVYRAALDCLAAAPERFQELLPGWEEELATVSHRPYGSGFLTGKVGGGSPYESSSYLRDYDFVAVVKGYDHTRGMLLLEQRNRFAVNDNLEIVLPRGDAVPVTAKALFDGEGNPIAVAPHAQMAVYLPYPGPLPAMTILRRKKNGT